MKLKENCKKDITGRAAPLRAQIAIKASPNHLIKAT